MLRYCLWNAKHVIRGTSGGTNIGKLLQRNSASLTPNPCEVFSNQLEGQKGSEARTRSSNQNHFLRSTISGMAYWPFKRGEYKFRLNNSGKRKTIFGTILPKNLFQKVGRVINRNLLYFNTDFFFFFHLY